MPFAQYICNTYAHLKQKMFMEILGKNFQTILKEKDLRLLGPKSFQINTRV